MIEIKKLTKFPNSFFSTFEIFNSLDGNLKIAAKEEISRVLHDLFRLLIIDFETGIVCRTIELKKEITCWNGWMRNIEGMRCLVSFASNSLFTVHFDDDFKVRGDYKAREKRCEDVYETSLGACVYHDHMIAFLSNNAALEVVFYDIKEEKLVDVWDAHNDESNVLTWIRTSDIVDFIFVGNFNQSVSIIEKSTRKERYKLSGIDFCIISRNVFYDFSGKYSFGVCGGTSRIKGKRGLNLLTLKSPVDSIETKLVDENLKKFKCFYSFGDEVFLGDNLLGKYEGGIQYRNKNEVINISKSRSSTFVVKNKGRDIFVYVEYYDSKDDFEQISSRRLRRELLKGKMIHFVNRDLSQGEDDPDERERVDYIRNMEDEQVEVLKIRILNVFDLFCFKSNLY